MPHSRFWRAVLIVFLCAVVAAPAHASTNLQSNARNIIVGVVAAAGAVVVLTIVLVHKSRHSAITGCVSSSAGNGLAITDEKDKQVYPLSGNTAGIKAGDRVELRGKKMKSKGTDTMYKTSSETKDFGACST